MKEIQCYRCYYIIFRNGGNINAKLNLNTALPVNEVQINKISYTSFVYFRCSSSIITHFVSCKEGNTFTVESEA